jgi:CheY-like chemotaxis protein
LYDDEKERTQIMVSLLIADKDAATRKRVANLFIEAGYDVTVTDSAAKAIDGVLKKTAQVLLLGTQLNEVDTAVLVPLLADDTPLPLIRKVRKEGIFYHALRPEEPEDDEEIRQAVKCAMQNLTRSPYTRMAHAH